jgi:hypothetical protein
MAVENKISLMPMSAFCLPESEYKLENFIRLAICKSKQFFQEEDLVKRFERLA